MPESGTPKEPEHRVGGRCASRVPPSCVLIWPHCGIRWHSPPGPSSAVTLLTVICIHINLCSERARNMSDSVQQLRGGCGLPNMEISESLYAI
jgi:hypothetical protein